MAKPSFIMVYQISSTDVRCGFELFPGTIPSIANGEMINFVRDTIAAQVHIGLTNLTSTKFARTLHSNICKRSMTPCRIYAFNIS